MYFFMAIKGNVSTTAPSKFEFGADSNKATHSETSAVTRVSLFLSEISEDQF